MSGQWEVVGKKREKTNKQIPQKVVKDVKKNNVSNIPKIEDVCKLNILKEKYYFKS